MSRRTSAPKRTILPDPKYSSDLLAKFTNMIMVSGKKSVAEGIIYGALDRIVERSGQDEQKAVELFGKALENVQGIVGYMAGAAFQSDPRNGGDVKNLYKVGQNSTRLLLGAGDLIVGWLLMRQAEVAKAALDAGASPKDVDFYTGKIAAAKFFVHQVLPRLAAERAMAESTDLSLMDVPEAAF